MRSIVFVIFVLSVFCSTNGAKILGFFNLPSKSHCILGNALLKGLAEKGHQVTMLSAFPSKKKIPNFTDIRLPGILEFKEEMEKNASGSFTNRLSLSVIPGIISWMQTVHELSLNNIETQKLLASNETYDVVITEWFGNEAFLGIAHKLKAHAVIFSAISPISDIGKVTGNPTPYSYFPHFFLPYTSEMTFFQRLINTIIYVFYDLCGELLSVQSELYQKFFPDGPPLQELMDNVSIALVNTHYSTDITRPYVPNVIPIGGFHIQESNEVTGKLKTFLDSAKEGVILFSFGSNVKLSALPKETLEMFSKVFAKLSMKVLWKSDVNIPNLSNNVHLEEWIPQNDVLGHPNVKLFLSHGGIGGVTEAIYNGVPIIGIPFFADQHKNVADCVQKGIGVHIGYFDLTEEKLEEAIKEILNNSKYRENIKKLSTLLKEQPINPLDHAIFWIEHVIRHNGAKHLKNKGVKLNFFQYFLLDVIVFLIITIISILALIYYTIKIFVRFLRKKFTGKKKTQ